MSGAADDRTLWEWVDAGSPELAAHLTRHPEDRARVEELRRVLAACRAERDAPVRARPERVGRYRLLRRIGRGGMGVVYEAEQDAPRRRVAVKLLSEAAFEDPRVRARLAREAEALGRLAHPHVAVVFEHGETAEGEPYVAMELVDGVALDAWTRERRSRRREVAEIVEKIARAVHHAHERGIVHRDLKPSNVLVDARGEPKVLDFGLAHVAGAGAPAALTTTGRVFGTLAYMSPEQARGESEGDARGDVYALGVILYEALAGELPHDLSARSPLQAARVIAEDAPRRLRRAVAGVDADLDVICGKALAPDPEQRYASAAELADDLRRHLDGVPVRARRASVVYRARRFVRRHALALGVTAGMLLLALFAAYAATLRVDLGPIQKINGDWYAEASPFEGVRWEGQTPVVRVDGAWHELVEIEGLHAGYVVGFCQQNAGAQWRRRFTQDLLEVLNRMGRWPIGTVDLVVRDAATGTQRTLADVPFTRAKRHALHALESTWYFGEWRWTDDGIEVVHEGRPWALVSIDGVAAGELLRAAPRIQLAGSSPRPSRSLDDAFLRAVDRTPHEQVEIVLRDSATGELLVIPAAERTYRNTGGLPRPAPPATAPAPDGEIVRDER